MTPATSARTASIRAVHRMHAGPAEADGRALRRPAIRAVEEVARPDALAAARERTHIATVGSTLNASAEAGRRSVSVVAGAAVRAAVRAAYGRTTWLGTK